MVTTDNPQYAETLRRFRNHGISSEARQRELSGQWHYDMVALGFNYRLPDIACALGLAQLGKLNPNMVRRRQIAKRYTTAFAKLTAIVTPVTREDADPAWHLYPIRVQPEVLGADRDEFLRALRAENIGANVHYRPVYLHSYYREKFGYRGGECPVAEAASARLVSLPMFHGMTDFDVESVIEAVEKVVLGFAK